MGALGASAAIVGITVGTSKFLGYALLSFSRCLVHRTGQYWAIILVGYAINLIAVRQWRSPLAQPHQ